MATILTIYALASVMYISLILLSWYMEYPYRLIEEKLGTWLTDLLSYIFLPILAIAYFIAWNFFDVESNELGKSETIKNK